MESSLYNPSPSPSMSPDSFSSCTTDDHDDFGGTNVVRTPYHGGVGASNESVLEANERSGCNKRTRTMGLNSTNLMSQYHVIAERRRRDKLSQGFIDLAKLIPSLKKMNKTSVLEEVVKYVKHLQERVKYLEEKAKPRNIESAMQMKKTHLFTDEIDDAKFWSSNEETMDLHSKNIELPEIEARVSNKDVLLRIYCNNQLGLLERILNEMEKFHLSISNSDSLSFGNYHLVITITAKLDENFSITAKELVSKLEMVF